MTIIRKTALFIVLTVLVSGVQNVTISGRQSRDPGSRGPEMIPLVDLLPELGRTYDCYFTLEQGWEDGEAMNALATFHVPKPREKTTVQRTVEELVQTVPHIKAEFTQKDRLIVHLIDTRLVSQKQYALAAVLPSIEFAGPVGELIAEIKKRGILLSLQTVFPLGRPIVNDISTPVRVKASNLTIRQVLSDSVPLAGYSRVIWTASTKLSSGAETVINFQGRRP